MTPTQTHVGQLAKFAPRSKQWYIPQSSQHLGMADMFPPRNETKIHFAHPAYRLAERFALLGVDVANVQTWDRDAMAKEMPNCHVLVASGFWDNALLDKAPNLQFIQACAAGYDQYDLAALKARGIRLCNSSGVNANAVSEHAMALLLALMRKLHTGRDNQHKHHWRGMISELSAREDELPGKTVLIYGAGKIGGRTARLCRAFEADVIGIKRDVTTADQAFNEIHPPEAFLEQLGRADAVILSCPLTDQTRNLMNAAAFERMRASAYLINVARGGCVDEPALIDALNRGQIAGAGIDVTVHEPLASDSPLWDIENAIVTPHTGGETQAYEDRVAAILADNLERLWRGEEHLTNQIV